MRPLKNRIGAAALGAAALFVGACSALALGDDSDLDEAKAEYEQDVAERLQDQPEAEVLVLGDSVMWWGEEGEASVAHSLAAALSRPVVNLSVPGARLSHPVNEHASVGLDIRAQFKPRDWEWVVLDGGANDLGDECGCRACEPVITQMVSRDGQRGQWIDLIERINSADARIVLVGYYEPPETGENGLALCGAHFEELNGRLERAAGERDGVEFVSMAEVVNPANASHFDPDMIHPSAVSSRAIGELIGKAIKRAEMAR